MHAAEKPMGIENLRKRGGAEESAEWQRHFSPVFCVAADGEDGQPDEGRGAGGEDGQNEAFDGAAEAKPGAEHGHKFGIAEAHAFLAADDPVGEADDEDERACRHDGEQAGERGR